MNSYSPKEQILIGKLCNGDQVKKLEVRRRWLLSVIIGGGLAAIVMIAAMMCWRGCLPDGKCIVASGLALGIVSLSIELIDLRILLAKVLRQQVQDAAADALRELRLTGRK